MVIKKVKSKSKSKSKKCKESLKVSSFSAVVGGYNSNSKTKNYKKQIRTRQIKSRKSKLSR